MSAPAPRPMTAAEMREALDAMAVGSIQVLDLEGRPLLTWTLPPGTAWGDLRQLAPALAPHVEDPT